MAGNNDGSPLSGKGRGSPAQNEIAELLASSLPYLSEGFCRRCKNLLHTRIQNLASSQGKVSNNILSDDNADCEDKSCPATSITDLSEKTSELLSSQSSHENFHKTPNSNFTSRWGSSQKSSSVKSVLDSNSSSQNGIVTLDAGSAINGLDVKNASGLSSVQNEQMRLSQVGRKKDFVLFERVDGKKVNVLQGLELHTRVFNTDEQRKIVDYVYNLQQMGRAIQLRERTYSEPRKWMRGKGRVTLQFGCCYNYAVDKDGNPPGIIRDEEVDPIPPLFKAVIKRLVRWHVLPPTAVPNSCIVNIYEEGDCIPPHIDHHDFLRPFCTVSFLTECNILFGSNLKIVGPGEFTGPAAIPLPIGSVLILNGNGADVAKHCVPGVPAKRISITFRKMDDSKIPYCYSPDPELQGLQPLVLNKSPSPQVRTASVHRLNGKEPSSVAESTEESPNRNLNLGADDFPPLGGGMGSVSRQRNNLGRMRQ